MLVVDELFDAEDILSGVLFIKHIRFQRVQLGLRNGLNAVVEAVNQHIAVFIFDIFAQIASCDTLL